MSTTTVRTQAELDKAVADKVSTIYIESPAGVRLTLTGSGSSNVVAWDSSSVEARDSSNVVARDSSNVVAWGSSRVVAGTYTAVHLHSARATVRGGVLIDLTKIDLTDPTQWLDYHGVKTDRGHVVLYKAVLDDFTTGRGPEWTYKPGSTVVAKDFAPTRECGQGLHFCASPALSATYLGEATRFVAIKVKAADLVPLDDKVKAPRCTVLWEVDRFGDRLDQAGAA